METVIIRGFEGYIHDDLWVEFKYKSPFFHSEICKQLAKTYGNYSKLSEVAEKYKFRIRGKGSFPYFYTKKELYHFIDFLNNSRFIRL